MAGGTGARERHETGDRPPTADEVRPSITATPLALFPSKGSPGEIQAGSLARDIHLLSAPSQRLTPQ